MKVIITDDEPAARLLLRSMLQKNYPEIEVVELCDDLPSTVKAIHKHGPDAVFLDIEMPGFSGLELLQFFSPEEVNFGVVFVTAYNQFALQAFRLSAVDYLLKPIQMKQLGESVAKLKERAGFKETVEELEALRNNLNPKQKPKLTVPTSEGKYFFDLDDLLYLRAQGAYTEVHSKSQKMLFVGKNLRWFEETLQEYPNFYRCHRSAIVNLAEVKGMTKKTINVLSLSNGDEIEFARERVDELTKRLAF